MSAENQERRKGEERMKERMKLWNRGVGKWAIWRNTVYISNCHRAHLRRDQEFFTVSAISLVVGLSSAAQWIKWTAGLDFRLGFISVQPGKGKGRVGRSKAEISM